MKYLLIPILALGIGTAAIAATPDSSATAGTYPACSKSVKDECTETAARPKAAPARHAHKIAHHHRHATAAKPS